MIVYKWEGVQHLSVILFFISLLIGVNMCLHVTWVTGDLIGKILHLISVFIPWKRTTYYKTLCPESGKPILIAIDLLISSLLRKISQWKTAVNNRKKKRNFFGEIWVQREEWRAPWGGGRHMNVSKLNIWYTEGLKWNTDSKINFLKGISEVWELWERTFWLRFISQDSGPFYPKCSLWRSLYSHDNEQVKAMHSYF